MAVKTPHFRTPFNVVGGKVAVVEQDSEREIMQCLAAILRTPEGSRIEEPEFGIPDELFSLLGPNSSVDSYLAALEEWEPRAKVLGVASIEELAEQITIEVEAP